MGNAIAHEVREALLAHAKKGIIGTYDQYEYMDEKRTALLLWADRLRDILAQPPRDLEKLLRN